MLIYKLIFAYQKIKKCNYPILEPFIHYIYIYIYIYNMDAYNLIYGIFLFIVLLS